MDYDDKIKQEKAKLVPRHSKQYKQHRTYCVLKNGKVKETIQHYRNLKNEHRYHLEMKKNQLKQIRHFFKSSSLPKIIKEINDMKPKLQLSELIIKYFHLIHPDFNLDDIKKDLINNIKDTKNSNSSTDYEQLSSQNNSDDATPVPPIDVNKNDINNSTNDDNQGNNVNKY